MRRFLALLSLVVTTVTGTQALPPAPGCVIAEQVYGVDHAGDLIAQPFCALPAGVDLPPRTLASFGAHVPQLFFGGQLHDATVVMYSVGADGALRWYRESSATGRLGPGVVVGSQFGDWRSYQYLHAADGDLSGVDAQGRLLRWEHSGWRNGGDTWGQPAPEDLGPICPGTRPVYTGRGEQDVYVGVATHTPSYVYCGPTGQARVASVLPAGVTAVTMAAYPSVAYALRQGDSWLTRLRLDMSGATPQWRTDAVVRTAFSVIFTGQSICAEGAPLPKYEWQWNWYGRYS